MAYKVIIQSVARNESGAFTVVFSNSDDANILYETSASSGGSSTVAAAIKKMCDQRKAAGVYNPSEPGETISPLILAV